MFKKLVVLTCIGLSMLSFAQKEELTLESAVMNQYRKYYPEHLFGFSWIPNSNDFTYLKGYVNLYKGSAKKADKAKEMMNVKDLNDKLDAELRWFSGFQWLSANEFMVVNGNKYYSYNVKEEKGSLFAELNESAAATKFEPRSKSIAYTLDNNVFINKGNKEVAVTNHKDKNIVAGSAIARSEFGITEGLFWSVNGNMLAFYQKDESEVHDYPMLDNTQTPGALKTTKYPMAGQKSEKSSVGIYNVATGKTHYITPRGAADDYLTNVCFTPDEKFVLVAEVNRDQNEMNLQKYTVGGEFVKTLITEKSETWTEPEHPAFFPSELDNNFIWVSERDGYNNLYYYDIDGSLIQQLTSNKFVVKEILTASVDGKEVFFSATGENPMNTMVYKVSLDGDQSLITETEGVHDASVNFDGSYVFDQYSNHSTPNVAQMLSGKGKLKSTMLTAKNTLENVTMGSAEISTIKSADGTTDLYQRLIKPSDFDPNKKYPVLVYVYGGPHAQLVTNSWLDGASLWMYWMAEQGYLVYTVDNRGSGERGKAFESVIHRQLGTAEIEDQLKGVEYLKSLPYVDGDRLAVHGWSFGGFMTTSLMLREPGTFTTGVAGGPVTDWKYYEVMYGERYMDRPEQNKEGYEQASLLTHAKNLEGDLLLIHGTIDPTVVLQHNYSLVQKFVELGIQMDYFPYPMHEHNVRGKDRVHLMTKVLNYVLEHN